MKCLILAAGYGSRLRGIAQSKPLAPVGGVALIEHVIARAIAAGVVEFVVVTGHEADRVEAFLAELASRLSVAVHWVRCENWDRPNGYSVLAGAAALDGEYLLLMSDHLFDPDIARRLFAASRSEAGVTLAVDRNLSNELLDIDDATKVEIDSEGRIVHIGKTLQAYNAVDTGIFRATPALAEAITSDIAAGGGGSLSEGMQRLAAEGRAWTMDVGSAQWVDVDSPAMLDLAEALVVQAAAQG